MQSDWSVACAAGDPMLVIPWSGEGETPGYIDLARNTSRVNEIPEAVLYGELATVLLQWNREDSPLFTAKCDVWNYPAVEFDLEDCAGFGWAQASYIDLIAKQGNVFSGFQAAEQRLRAWNAVARSIELPACRCEWTLRPARILAGEASGSARDGFATTLYVWGYGESLRAAEACWSAALGTLAEPVIRFR